MEAISSSDKLLPLRDEIQTITESIMILAKKRQELANEVATIKDASGIPIENLEVERQLRCEVNKLAQSIGLEETFAGRMLDLLLDFSKSSQRKEIFQSKILSFLNSEKIESILVIGSGRMGGWIASYFRGLDRKVALFDKKVSFARRRAKELDCDSLSEIQNALNFDLVFIAVPISETRGVLSNLSNLIQKGARCRAIIEASSIKDASRHFEVAPDDLIPIIHIHPLFGPLANNFGRNAIVVIKRERPSKNDRFPGGYNFARKLFPQFDILELDAESHNRQMALLLTLPHALAFAFLDVASRYKGRLKISTPSFDIMNDFAAKVLGENPDVYFEIQSMNKFSPEVLRDLMESIVRLSHYFQNDERIKFRRKFFKKKISN